MLKLEALIDHPTKEGCLKAARGRHGRHVEESIWVVVFPDLDTIVGVDTRSCGRSQNIRAHAIIVEYHREPGLRAPHNLAPQSGFTVEPGVGLPSINDPGLDLQLCSRKILDAQAVEEPWRVGRNIGG